MASPVRTYQSEMHEKLGFYANWLPGDPLSVGDVGVLADGRFRRLSSLKELGIKPVAMPAGTFLDVQYTSTRGTSIGAAAGADAVAARAQIAIDFSASGAFLFHAFQMRPTRLENRAEVAEKMLEAFEMKQWQKEWLLIESVHTATSATVIIAEDSKAQLVLSAEAKGPISGLALADPNAKFSVVSTQGHLFHAIGAKELRPLYSCLRLDDPLIGSPKVVPVRGAQAGAAASLSRPTIEELLES